MKNIIYKYSVKALAVAILVLTAASCSDDFLKEKKLYGSFNGTTIYENYTSADNRITYLYKMLLPKSTGGMDECNYYNDLISTGENDTYSQLTEEYGGMNKFNNPTSILDNTTTPDYFQLDVNYQPYSRIREVNDMIAGINGSSSLTEEEKHLLLGQAYFWRAYRYYLLVKCYGGVPLIKEVQNPVIGNTQGENLVVPRSSTKDCVAFIDSDFIKAAEYLPTRWENGASNFGRITAGCALAMKGRMDLLYASPVFNRSDDAARWEQAYETNKAAIEKLKAGNFGLAYASNPGTNASNWAKMFSSFTGSENLDQNGTSEAVFITLYNNLDPVEHLQVESWNGWENEIRPINAGGSGGKTPTAEEVDLFPMADGKRPGESAYPYSKGNEITFFLNRDPRFYRTFAFPGEQWKFSSEDLHNFGFGLTDDGNAASGKLPYGIKLSTTASPYTTGEQYELWSYCWYEDADTRSNENSSGWAADCLGSKNSSVYIRKRCDDMNVNSSPLYVFDAVTSNGFKQSAAPYMDMRYAEVLLNFAEAACGANHLDEALDALKQIRQRVGYTGDCGLDPDLASSRAKMFEAILYERQIELAYEGKRFDDVRRWMLFDGGVGQETICPNWKLTGFDGNTCTYLGVTPLNGVKRHRIEIFAKDFVAKKANNVIDANNTVTTAYDALYDQRPAALQLNETITGTIDEAGTGTYGTGAGTKADLRVKGLAEFYNAHFQRKNISQDGNDETIVPTYKPFAYFLGFKQNAQQNNISLVQNMGWNDYWTGATGAYDPLSDNPVTAYEVSPKDKTTSK